MSLRPILAAALLAAALPMGLLACGTRMDEARRGTDALD